MSLLSKSNQVTQSSDCLQTHTKLKTLKIFTSPQLHTIQLQMLFLFKACNTRTIILETEIIHDQTISTLLIKLVGCSSCCHHAVNGHFMIACTLFSLTWKVKQLENSVSVAYVEFFCIVSFDTHQTIISAGRASDCV